MDETTQAAIIDALEEMVAEVAPDLHGRSMYGGQMLEHEAGVAASAVGGYFAYKNHVSFEFSNGAQLRDPAGHLEGKGKARRHVKLRSVADIAEKDVAGFLAEAAAQS
ncbi:DUF1801 domain-containing protein [Shimia sagamensis]|uniref:YdhG-like domain-containing protein n=1 Tax=Shimia sagamensis TaxID=1566352 RepID=A0ABY1NX44_9RHOB|nr:DUF1801 domain-containing protein [Shimia sagamensis]SMP18092.1 protein of unknown function (DU1801) [Shimia sagamensis]